MSYPLFQVRCMKHYPTRYRRHHLLPVPYSVRPDRIERGLRILRALRLALSRAAADSIRGRNSASSTSPSAKRF